jgi:hypothetical protein
MRFSTISLLSLVCFVAAVSALPAQPSKALLTKNWVLTCQDCNESLSKCTKTCVKAACKDCVANIENIMCRRCGMDVVNQDSNSFYCDASVPMHQQACRLNCRSRLDANPFYRSGSCDPYYGQCFCCM